MDWFQVVISLFLYCRDSNARSTGATMILWCSMRCCCRSSRIEWCQHFHQRGCWEVTWVFVLLCECDPGDITGNHWKSSVQDWQPGDAKWTASAGSVPHTEALWQHEPRFELSYTKVSFLQINQVPWSDHFPLDFFFFPVIRSLSICLRLERKKKKAGIDAISLKCAVALRNQWSNPKQKAYQSSSDIFVGTVFKLLLKCCTTV